MTMPERKTRLPVTGLLLLAIALSVALWQGRSLDVATIIQRVGELGPLALLAYMAIYVLANVLFLPGSILTLAGGSLFGPVLGTFVNLTGATLGATLAFLLSRYLASDWVERKAAAGGEDLIRKAILALALRAVAAFLPRMIGRFRQGPALSIDNCANA